jgi:enamine deaminase RidA (YjgF/YER057c/UK114 family)
MSIEQRLAELGITLPEPAAPVAAYVPAVEAGGLLYISGQVSQRDGKRITGRLGADLDVDAGRDAAQSCGIMLLAQMKAALGSLDHGDAGKHARSAVGVPSLPLGVAVEIDAVVAVRS